MKVIAVNTVPQSQRVFPQTTTAAVAAAGVGLRNPVALNVSDERERPRPKRRLDDQRVEAVIALCDAMRS